MAGSYRHLKAIPLFAELEDEELEHIASVGIRRGFRAGTELFRQGEPGSIFYVVLNGSVKIYSQNDEGKEKILSVMRSGDFFGEFSVIDGGSRSANARALEDSEFLTFTREQFNELLEQYHSMMLNLIRMLAVRLRQANEQVMDIVFLDAKTQILKTLINLANQHGERSGSLIKLNVRFSMVEIAEMSGISLDLTSSVIRELEYKGVLTQEFGYYYLNMGGEWQK